MKSDDQEFNYKQNQVDYDKNKNDMKNLSIALEKRMKEDRLVNYVGLVAISFCLIFLAWEFLRWIYSKILNSKKMKMKD